jgi:hypothetical protein
MGKREPHMGPQRSSQWIRERALPSSFAVPGGAISFTSPSDLQTKIDANPSMTDFVSAGSMTWTSNVNTGTKAPRIWIPTAHVLDANGAQIVGLTLRDGAELHGGTWTDFASVGGQTFHTPVIAGGVDPWAGPVLIEDAIFHHNYESGVHAQCDNATIRRCLMYSNGRYGWDASIPAGGAPARVGLRVENSQWYDNNTRQLSTADDAGGNKASGQIAVYIGRCWPHDNYGSGIWTDFSYGQHIIEENVVERNRTWGIFYEMGDGNDAGLANAIIRHNYLLDNCLGAAESWFNAVQLLASSDDGLFGGGVGFEIHNNVIDGSVLALGFVDGDGHPSDARGMHAHDNDIWLRGASLGRVGGSKEGTFDPFASSAGNTYRSNRYHVTNSALAKWRWDNVDKTWAQWQALGNDVDGVLLVDA